MILRDPFEIKHRQDSLLPLEDEQLDQDEAHPALWVWSDGGCSANPGGVMSIGVVIRDTPDRTRAPLCSLGARLGHGTSNEAEYRGAIRALEEAQRFGGRLIVLHLDSQLVAYQLSGKYAVNEPRLRMLHRRATELMSAFGGVEVVWVRREQNHEADALAEGALVGVAA